MKTASTKSSKKKPAKPKHTWIHLKYETADELEFLENIKKLTGIKVGTKAVQEALINYPKLVKRSDGLNHELIKVNREHEQLTNKMEAIRRAFSFINDTDQKPKQAASNVRHYKQKDLTCCPECDADLEGETFCTQCLWDSEYDKEDDDEY
jgi:hypothetical protein